MKKLLVASIAAAAFCSAPASAADVPVTPVYKAPPAVAYGWTGFYVGGNVGYGVARNPSGSTLSGFVDDFAETFNLSPRGVLGGGQVGYNWQAAPNWVFGIEADIQASAQTDSTTCVTFCGATFSTRVSQKLPWFGTLRGRLGWTNGPALYYLTGGLAYGQVTTDVAVNVIGGGIDARSFSHTKSGWTIGGGIETQLAGNWTAKVEYLYVDLGRVTDSFVYAPDPGFNYLESSAIRNHVVRLGLNYKLGDPGYATGRSGSIVKAPVAFNWSGFYLGANVGYGVARNPSESTNLFLGVPNFAETFNLSPHGVLGGGQVGYNWQAAPNWVLGIEADIQASAQTDSTTCVTRCDPIEFMRVSQKLPWFGTLRGRLGWTNGPALYYLTGGLAYGKVTTDIALDLGTGIDARSFSHTKSGWTVGGGIEAQVIGNWTAKVEYLYIDLGSVTDSFAYAFAPVFSNVESSAIRNHVARIALNYRFGGPN